MKITEKALQKIRAETQLIVKTTFKCRCGKIQTVMYESNHQDNLNYHCSCGEYYKKAIRIDETQILVRSVFER